MGCLAFGVLCAVFQALLELEGFWWFGSIRWGFKAGPKLWLNRQDSLETSNPKP